MLAAAAVLATLAGGCTDLPQRWALDGARVLAVRLSAPGLAADEQATIDALVVDEAGVPSVIAPALVTVAVEGPAPLTVSAGEDGWTATAGDAEAIAAARVSAGLTAEQPLEVPIGAAFAIAEPALIAVKRVRLGETAANPPTPSLRVDGAIAAGAVTVDRGRAIALTVEGALGVDDEPALEIAWLTSTGTLTGSQTAAATLELAADDPGGGHVVVIVRSEVGGVAWAWTELAVR